MSKMLSRVILAVVLCGGLQSAALADELDHDMCFSMGAADFDWLTCNEMEKKFHKAVAKLESYAEPETKKLLRSMTKKEKEKFFELNEQERDWRFVLLGKTTSSCQDVELDHGTWHVYRRKEGKGKGGVPLYSHEIVKEEDLERTGMLASLMAGFTPTRAMVCVDWRLGLQGPVESALTSKIAEEFFEYDFLQVLQVRTK